jgi:hypothetical protein
LFGFYHWSVEDPDQPDSIRKLVVKNDTKANMIFNVSVDGPFEIVGAKTNTGATHPLAQRPSSRSIKSKPETMYNLQPEKILQIATKFITPNPTDKNEWPEIIRVENEGRLNIAFANGVQ